MANDPKQPDPDPRAPIPVAQIAFPAGVKLDIPGKRGVQSALRATKPSAGEYWSIVFDPKLRHHVVAHFRPGTDPKRPPVDTLCIPEAMATWRRA